MAFVIAGLIVAGAFGMQVLLIFAEMSRPIPSGKFMPVFWPAVIGLPLAILVFVSHWLPHVGW